MKSKVLLKKCILRAIIAKTAEREERKLFEEQRRKLQLDAQEAAQKEKRERERLEAERINTFLVSRDEETSLSVRDFCAYVEQHKLVSIDDLADRFQRPSGQVLE
jgi:hypothetical protein